MRLFSIALVILGLMAPPLAAQSLFGPAITVNDSVITGYELSQRQKMLAALGVQGDLRAEARSGLVGDRLKVAAAEAAGIVPTEAQLDNALSAFAARGNRSTAQLEALLAGRGVARETLRDFVYANLVWQTLIGQRYGPSVQVSESEIDAALANTSEATNLQVLVSEVILPLIEGQEEQIRQLARDISNLRSFDEFEAAARQFSVAGSRVNGGKLDWLSLANLPPALRPVLLPLSNGEVSQPLDLPNAIALFQMRGVREVAPNAARYASVDYAVLTVAEDERGTATAMLSRFADTALRCDDLEGLASDLPQQALQRRAVPPSDIPTRTAMVLARLDTGETAIEPQVLADGSAQVQLLMLCNRTSTANRGVSRDDVRSRLVNEKLTTRADSLLESLRASARIVE